VIRLFIVFYLAMDAATFLFLIFWGDKKIPSMDWFIELPFNLFFAQIWPVYWMVYRPIFGA